MEDKTMQANFIAMPEALSYINDRIVCEVVLEFFFFLTSHFDQKWQLFTKLLLEQVPICS